MIITWLTTMEPFVPIVFVVSFHDY